MTSFWDYLSAVPIETKLIIGVLLLFGVYKGIVKIPYIAWPRERRKEERIHKECPLYPEFIDMRNYAIELGAEPCALVRRQMILVEDKFEEPVRTLLLKHFLKLLPDDEAEPIRAPDAKDYLLAVNYSLFQVKSKIRSFARDNHLADISEAQFMQKMRERTDQVIGIFTSEMNESHPVNLSITRRVVYQHNEELDDKIKEMLNYVWLGMRELAIESKNILAEKALTIEK